jgi:hypothetical protein
VQKVKEVTQPQPGVTERPHRLTTGEREHLAALLQFNPGSERRTISSDLAEAAVGGRNLPPEVVQCLAALLASSTAPAPVVSSAHPRRYSVFGTDF